MNEKLLRFKVFCIECQRVFTITKKPSREEFMTITKVSALGLLLIGLIGFIVLLIVQMVS